MTSHSSRRDALNPHVTILAVPVSLEVVTRCCAHFLGGHDAEGSTMCEETRGGVRELWLTRARARWGANSHLLENFLGGRIRADLLRARARTLLGRKARAAHSIASSHSSRPPHCTNTPQIPCKESTELTVKETDTHTLALPSFNMCLSSTCSGKRIQTFHHQGRFK